MQTLMGSNGCSCTYIFGAQAKACFLMFSHMNLVSPIFILTQGMLIELICISKW